MIFDIKMDSKFTRRAWLVTGGHNTTPPSPITYFIVVIMESVRLAFIISVLNNLYIYACNIGK